MLLRNLVCWFRISAERSKVWVSFIFVMKGLATLPLLFTRQHYAPTPKPMSLGKSIFWDLQQKYFCFQWILLRFLTMIRLSKKCIPSSPSILDGWAGLLHCKCLLQCSQLSSYRKNSVQTQVINTVFTTTCPTMLMNKNTCDTLRPRTVNSPACTLAIYYFWKK